MPTRLPQHQTVCELQHRRPWRIASALLAADSDATVVCRLGTSDVALARELGVRMLGPEDDLHDALVETGLGLIDANALTTSAWPSLHAPTQADCLVHEAAPQNLAPRTLWIAERGCWRTSEGVTRRLRVPGAPPPVDATHACADLRALLAGGDSPLSSRIAWEAACVLWLSGWLPRFADVLGWTRERLRRGVNLRVYR